MSVIEHRRTGPWADVLSWLDEAELFARSQSPQVRVEDFVEEETYVIRADVPGVDPERDLDVHVENGRLVVKGERREESHEKNRRDRGPLRLGPLESPKLLTRLLGTRRRRNQGAASSCEELTDWC